MVLLRPCGLAARSELEALPCRLVARSVLGFIFTGVLRLCGLAAGGLAARSELGVVERVGPKALWGLARSELEALWGC